MHRRVFVGVVATGVIGLTSGAGAQELLTAPGLGWAEKDSASGREMDPKLVTEDKWKEHHESMRTRNGEARYRREVDENRIEGGRQWAITSPPAAGKGTKR